MHREFDHHEDLKGGSILKRAAVLLLAMSCGLLIGSILAPAKDRLFSRDAGHDNPVVQQYWIVPI
jgi:hypothetical protein